MVRIKQSGYFRVIEHDWGLEIVKKLVLHVFEHYIYLVIFIYLIITFKYKRIFLKRELKFQDKSIWSEIHLVNKLEI